MNPPNITEHSLQIGGTVVWMYCLFGTIHLLAERYILDGSAFNSLGNSYRIENLGN